MRYPHTLLVPAMALSLLVPLSGALAASFDCARATHPVGKIICADEKIAHMDDTLDKVYKEALGTVPDRAALIASQRAWVAARNACPDPTCVVQVYRSRIDTLRHEAATAQPGQPAEPKAARPYKGENDPLVGNNASGDALFATSVVIEDCDMYRLFTNKGDFYWAPWMQAKVVESLERKAAGLKGQEARITYAKVAGKGDVWQCMVQKIGK